MHSNKKKKIFGEIKHEKNLNYIYGECYDTNKVKARKAFKES